MKNTKIPQIFIEYCIGIDVSKDFTRSITAFHFFLKPQKFERALTPYLSEFEFSSIIYWNNLSFSEITPHDLVRKLVVSGKDASVSLANHLSLTTALFFGKFQVKKYISYIKFR